METEKLPEFRRRLAKAVQAQLANTPPEGEEPTLTVDAWLGLADLSLGLAAEMEQLAPFGPGNERLTLATRSLEIVSTTVLGNGEHLKLTVQDIAGNKQQVLWWGGAGEALPAGRFDLAYTLRGSDYKGKRQTAIEFVALRPVDDSALIAASLPPAWEVLDWRKEADPAGLVRSLTGSVIIWAEGEHKQEIAGVGREALTPADTLVIWTTPPYNDVLREALRKVNPRRVILVCKMPGWLALERLAGALKFVLNKREGRVSLTALAASVGERETVTRLGLEYFMKRGQVRVLEELEGVLRLEQGNAAEDESAAVVKSRFLRLIEESAAFRRRFAQLQNPLEDV
jgi:single-stranded-DNA-specific exonuclease